MQKGKYVHNKDIHQCSPVAQDTTDHSTEDVALVLQLQPQLSWHHADSKEKNTSGRGLCCRPQGRKLQTTLLTLSKMVSFYIPALW